MHRPLTLPGGAVVGHARIQKVLREGSNSDEFFLCIDEGSENQNNTKSRPSSACHRNSIECWLGRFVMFQGIRTSIARKVNPQCL